MFDERHQKDSHFSPTADGLLHRQQPLPFLPDELIFQILLLLPVRSLLLFKSVCKSWKTLISTPQFAKTHLRSLTLNPTITHQRLFSSCLIGKPRKILSLAVKPLLENPSELTKPVEFSMEHRFVNLGSCNGLLCLFDMDQDYVKLWNPSINFESKKSPIIDFYDKVDDFIMYCGFGYDHVNDKYKVLIGFQKNVTRLYTFGENSWKIIHNFPCRPTTWLGKFVRGSLNWVVSKSGVSSNQSVILSFDIETETYKEVLLPEHDGFMVCNPMLGVLNNCLYVCFDSNGTHMVLWLMKIYGVAESWTRLTMIPHEKSWSYFQYSRVDDLSILENGIVLVRKFFAYLYNFNNGRVVNLPDCSIQGLYQHIYHESLVSLQ